MNNIAPQVFHLEASYVNLYLCIEEDGLTLIDSGMPRSEKVVWEAMAAIGRQRSDLAHILITHADLDHAGSAAAIQAETGAMVYAGQETAVLLQKGKSPQHMPWPIQIINDYFIRYKPIPAEAITIFQDGDLLPIMEGIQVLATPGHTLDHHSFYSPATGVLFAGDALNTRNGRLQSTPKRITANQTAARQSAIRLLELTPATIACGHGLPSSNHSSEDIMNLFNQLRTSEV